MNTAQSTARPACEYRPTIIETRSLIRRLMAQFAFLRRELKQTWTQFKTNPIAFTTTTTRELLHRLRQYLSAPYVARAWLTAVAVITCIMLGALQVDRGAKTNPVVAETEEKPDFVFLDVSGPDPTRDPRLGKNGTGRVGFQDGLAGEGSGPSRQLSRGGGSGGNHNPRPPQTGKLPPPSSILAAIPTHAPLNPPALPVGGIDIDPALWKDLKDPVYGDPRTISKVESKGPGEGEGIGINRGLGIGLGDGAGYGPGKDGNIGDGRRQIGCCGGGGNAGGGDGAYSGSQVEQRARLLVKPEPQYTEEARRNQVTGTVMLRVVFASNGEVVQIRALRTLPFGLTERAIAAARQIRFEPAMKDGRPVSVFMQLEYNFNLY
jgi:TonB family protein